MMAESMYLVTVGVNEELEKIRSNRFLVQLLCDAHTGVDVGDQEATACEMAKDAVKQLYPIAGEIGYTEANQLTETLRSDPGKEDYTAPCGSCRVWLVAP
jgi:hypothetical protein